MTKIALIVGASSGVGCACLKSLALAGCTVIGAARRVDRIRAEVTRLPAADPLHESIELDVTRPEAFVELASDLMTRKMTPDILIYCAGINQYGLLDESDADAWQRTFSVNTKGAFDMCAAFVPQLRRGSRIILVGSTAGLHPFEGGTIYCASKAALHAFSIALRNELRPRDIAVSTVIPGSINTDFWQSPRPDSMDLLSADLVAQIIANAAMAPQGSEVSEVVVRPTTEV